MIGLYEYEGMNPIPPELFLLPDWVPLHPNNYYCHTRYIYLGIAYLYGRRFRHELAPALREALRAELYAEPYDAIDFAAHRHDLAPSDLHVRPSLPLRAVTAATALVKAYGWLRDAQMQDELPDYERQRREPIRGGWCFSDGVHRWAVSDCTAEAMTALLEAEATPGLLPDGLPRIGEARLAEAARFILRRQNRDGGFGSYESRRGSAILEYINPSEMYGNCM